MRLGCQPSSRQLLASWPVQAVESYIGKRSWSELGPRKSLYSAPEVHSSTAVFTRRVLTLAMPGSDTSQISVGKGRSLQLSGWRSRLCCPAVSDESADGIREGGYRGEWMMFDLERHPTVPLTLVNDAGLIVAYQKNKIGFFLASKKRVPEAAERLNAQTIDFPEPTPRPDI
jgi:hypothetical protein